MKYFAFCDPSGGSSDSMTLALASNSILGKKAVLVGAWEKTAPFNPDNVTEEFAEILKTYRVTTATGDRYSAEWVVTRFRSHGILYVPSEKTKSEIYLEFLALTNSDRVRIPSNKRLRAQLVSLERRVSRTGKDSVDHPPAAHDDMANAVAGALVLAAKPAQKFFMPQVIDLGESSPPDPGTWTDPYANLSPTDIGPERWWRKIN